jgi:hypothetical protein
MNTKFHRHRNINKPRPFQRSYSALFAVEEVSELIPIAAAGPSESFLVFIEHPVPPRTVGIGWLVLNPVSTGDDHCRLETALTEFDVIEIKQRWIHHT